MAKVNESAEQNAKPTCPLCRGPLLMPRKFFVSIHVLDNALMKNGRVYMASACCNECHKRVVFRSRTSPVTFFISLILALSAVTLKLIAYPEIPWPLLILGIVVGISTVVWGIREWFGANLIIADPDLISEAKHHAMREFRNATPHLVPVAWLPTRTHAVGVDARRSSAMESLTEGKPKA